MNDREITELLFARDEAALKVVSKKYGKLCFSVAMNILGNELDAEECLNDTLLAVWNAIPPAEPTNLSAFMIGIARRQALKRLEFREAECRCGTPTPIDELAEVLPDESFDDASSGEVLAAIEAFLREQKPAVRRMFVKRYYAFVPIAEIASVEGCGIAKIKSQLHRTREKLREYLRKEGFKI